MTQQEQVRYERRTLGDWVERASIGEVALADFQRSFVWNASKSTEYIKSILQGKPVGLYLILAASSDPQFGVRSFNNMEGTPLDEVAELVLDGQQRLTSLMHALCGHKQRRFFIKMEDLSAQELKLLKVTCESKKNGRTSKNLDNPATAFNANLIPIDILRKAQMGTRHLSRLAKWCIDIGREVEGMDDVSVRLLEDRITMFFDRCFFLRELWYCLLPPTTSADEATEIFVVTNTSSVRIKRFDIEVANARVKGENLREDIHEAYLSGQVLRSYFPDDPEEHIPDIGEWMLKIACLHQNLTPKENHYEQAIQYLTGSNESQRSQRLKEVFDDLEWALGLAEQFGAPTRSLLPSQPVLYVLAALRSKFQEIRNPAQVDVARRLLYAYYWRCLFSNRHEVQANDRLHLDHKQLLKILKDGRFHESLPTAFDDREHPLFDASYLERNAGWLNSGRLGKALVSIVLEGDPVDWITGEDLTAVTVRTLQMHNDLDKHHVFPKKVLLEGGVKANQIQNGLNGVVLNRRTNLKLSKMPPSEYLDKILTARDIDEEKLKSRVQSHLVPYRELKAGGSIKQQYERYIMGRAKTIADRIEALATWP